MSQGGQFTSQPPVAGEKRCPHCDAPVINQGAADCWLCQEPLGGGTAVTDRPLPPHRGQQPEPGGGAFAAEGITDRPAQRRPVAPPRSADDNPLIAFLGLLFLLVCAGLIIENPGLGILLVIVATPALVRAVFLASRRREEGAPMTGFEKVNAFIGSLGAVATVAVAAFVAFAVMALVAVAAAVVVGVVCSGRPPSRPVRGLGLVDVCAGLTVAALVLFLLGWSMWRDRS